MEEFKCPICGKVFKTREELEAHAKKEHPMGK
ncbi:MAG TPA: C2H2-type zinc finger protein [Methanoregulaceae archaeon]|nr:C2H2-type zinc finger protein [Methanoregulaceae archaeon]